MSPEQLQRRQVGFQSDLYSLGVSMYELCTGVLPSTAACSAEEGDAGNPVPPHHLSSAVDMDLSEIILTAMEPDLDKRFRSALNMRAALDEYLSSEHHRMSDLAYPEYWALAFTKAPSELEGTVFAFNSPASVGRSPQAAIPVDDPSVSSEHALLTPRGLYLEVEDLVSTNGTTVNGQRITYRQLCREGSWGA